MTNQKIRQEKRKQQILARYSSLLQNAQKYFAETIKSIQDAGETIIHESIVSRPSGNNSYPEKIFYVIFCEKHVCILNENQKIFTLKGDNLWMKPYSEIAVREGIWKVNPISRALYLMLSFGLFYFILPSSLIIAQLGIIEKKKWTWFGNVSRNPFDSDIDDYEKVSSIIQERGGKVFPNVPHIKNFNGLGGTISTAINK
ncbi:MAG: hypothetical protein KAS17_06890 [Victivallaceae bacterium]|nr:hypothetical protein [Victivallaceae bacterium]